MSWWRDCVPQWPW